MVAIEMNSSWSMAHRSAGNGAATFYGTATPAAGKTEELLAKNELSFSLS